MLTQQELNAVIFLFAFFIVMFGIVLPIALQFNKSEYLSQTLHNLKLTHSERIGTNIYSEYPNDLTDSEKYEQKEMIQQLDLIEGLKADEKNIINWLFDNRENEEDNKKARIKLEIIRKKLYDAGYREL